MLVVPTNKCQERFWFAFFDGLFSRPAKRVRGSQRILAMKKIIQAIDTSHKRLDMEQSVQEFRFGEFAFLFANLQYRLPEPFRSPCQKLAQRLYQLWHQVTKIRYWCVCVSTNGLDENLEFSEYCDNIWALHAATILGAPSYFDGFNRDIHRQWLLSVQHVVTLNLWYNIQYLVMIRPVFN